jgi:hypothetical protein
MGAAGIADVGDGGDTKADAAQVYFAYFSGGEMVGVEFLSWRFDYYIYKHDYVALYFSRNRSLYDINM